MSGTQNPLLGWGAEDPRYARQNALAPTLADARPTWADAMSYNAPVVQQHFSDQWADWQRPEFWKDTAVQYANSLLLGTSAPGFRAYHGSPHSFDRFDLSKIGTGEGAQAYGHGLYFAENEAIARGYRDALSPSGIEIMRGGKYAGRLPTTQVVNDPAFVEAYQKLIPADNVPGWIKSGIMRDIHASGEIGKPVDLGAARDRTLARLVNESPPSSKEAITDAVGRAYDSIGPDVQFRAPGQMYEVNVNANPDHFLDWDRPLSEQSPHVREALAKTEYLYHADRAGMTNPTGGELVKKVIGDAASGSLALRAAGIPGIRYLDAGSRGAREGSRNTVVFDDSLIELIRKYGIAAVLGGGAAAAAAGGQPGT